MLTNAKVVKAWIRGKVADNGRSTLHTDGSTLSSYNLEIGYTDKKGEKIVRLYTANTGNFRSKTTTSHCNLAEALADRSESPS